MNLLDVLIRITKKEILGALFTRFPFLSFLNGPLGFVAELGLKFLLEKTTIGLNMVIINLVAKGDGESLEKVRQVAIELLKSGEATNEEIEEIDKQLIEKLRKLIRLDRTPVGSHSS